MIDDLARRTMHHLRGLRLIVILSIISWHRDVACACTLQSVVNKQESLVLTAPRWRSLKTDDPLF